MNTYRKTAIIVGVFFIAAIVTYGIGDSLIGSLLDAPNFLVEISANENQMLIGVILELINSAVVVGIAVLMYPILKKQNEPIALGFFSFRIIEAVILIVAVISPLLLIPLSQEYIHAGAPDASYFQTLGTLAIEGYYLAYQLAIVALGLGGLLFCYLLYQSNLIPRFISVLGLIGYPLMLTGALLEITGYDLGLIFSIPGGIFEISIAVWLIIKGFNPSALASDSAK